MKKERTRQPDDEVVCQNCGSIWGVHLSTTEASVHAELRGCPICLRSG